MDENNHKISFINNTLKLSQSEFINNVICDLDSRRKLIKQITETRIKRNITQKDIAKAVGCSRQTISSIEKFHSSPHAKTILGMVKFLNMTLKVEVSFKLDNNSKKD